ncbi:MAG: hypothetical protein ABIL22_04220 [candidate division WOR-3 bacterium]
MTPEQEGRLLELVNQIMLSLKETQQDVKNILSFQAKTEERLRYGTDHFDEIDCRLKEHDILLSKVPTGKSIYSVIGIGFTVLALLITIYKFWGNL